MRQFRQVEFASLALWLSLLPIRLVQVWWQNTLTIQNVERFSRCFSGS